ncbi:Fic family protein [Lentzea sp. NBRC 102530]|uniref:Fic/DOC family protein n=1 Tax=Lentzea sp. NBRC 102530 TaxID=3032201 RepID=UPI0024A3C3EB|nr:Fic family protein [Lentzea sp. NBRC 102530]GLY54479.1 Fic family protein [Lentzea sp. NBRC 102530]
MSDPYLIPGTDCLANKLGLADPDKLREIEARLVSIRDVQLARETLPGEYNLTHLQAFHRALFQDVYHWAGEIRTVNISKQRSMFAAWQFVEDQTSAVLARLEDDNWLIGASREHFIERLAYYYGELNVCHPFREGNGRAQRAFLRQLSAAAGWRLDWSALNKAGNVAASEQALLAADFALMQHVLEPVVVRM